MKILITGNMGYVGPVLTAHLRDVNPSAQLIGADLGFFGHCLTGAPVLPESRLDAQYFVDVRNMPEALLEDVDGIVHLAAISNDPMGKAFAEVTMETNYKASVQLAARAKAAQVKSFVFASSCSLYGSAEGAARNENSALNPLTAYAQSKINTEQGIKDLASTGFVITSLRFPTACGMSDRLRLDLVLNDFVASAVASKKIQVLSDGTPWRPLIDVQDMARAIEWALRRRASSGGAFLAVNVGRNEWNYQVKDLADAVRAAMPGAKVEINKDAQPDKRSYKVDFSLYRELAPDYLPIVSLDQSIRELKEGLEGLNFKESNFRDTDYIRLKVLTRLRENGLLNDRLAWVGSRKELSGPTFF